MKAIRVHQTGSSEVMHYEDVTDPNPKAGEVLVKIEAAGVNYIDIYHRTGLYPLPLPFTLGLEAAGRVESVGSNVAEFKVGDRVAYASQQGSYAEYNVVPVEKLVPVPQKVSLPTAAAVMLQGMTAHYLVRSTYRLKGNQIVLIHAAAGGVGLLLVQLAKQLGATVIGTVSTEEKAELARKAGADHLILYTQTDFEEETKRLTNGQGVHVVYDSVGLDTFVESLNVLRPRGYLVLFGQASGVVPPFDLSELARKGSLFITRPSLFHYIAQRKELLWRADDLFRDIANGKLDVRIDRTLPLAEAAEAHCLLSGRKTAGKLILEP